jgi:hypothetical protein
MRQFGLLGSFLYQLECVVTLGRVLDPLCHLDEMASDWRHNVALLGILVAGNGQVRK